MKNKNAFTLIELLLSLTLILLLSTACIFNFNTLNDNKTQLKFKADDYITLNKFVRANAELSGKNGRIFIETNKLKVVLIDFQGNINKIDNLQNQLDSLNDFTIFENDETNLITYFPDGSINRDSIVRITLENDTNSVLIKISEMNRSSVLMSTNKVDDEENDL